jgi:PadR family transcriptional regulator PadR
VEDIVEQLQRLGPLVAPALLLLLAESPSHGYELVERLTAFGLSDGRPGSLYRDLRRLEDAGLVRSYWEASQVRGPARRVYELTRPGYDALEACANSADDLIACLREYQTRYAALGARSRQRLRHRRPAGATVRTPASG